MLNFIKNLFRRKPKESIIYEDQNDKIYLQSIFVDGYILEVGKKVICKSNEPEDFFVGTIKSFYHLRKWGDSKNAIPVVEDEYGNLWNVMGIVRPYTNKLISELSTLRGVEQWNYLVKPHAQIKEKYGIQYKTFNN